MSFTVVLILVIAGGIVLDQATKLIVANTMELYQSVDVIPRVLRLTYIRNRGAAFGMLDNHRWVFISISTVAIIAISIYLFRYCKEGRLFKLGLALIVSGGIGNMIDRVILGYVIDMIDFCPFDFWVWIFNVADSLVCVGAGIVIFALIRDIIKESRRKESRK